MIEDGKRLMSYIYSYSNDVKSKNVGFVKAEIKNRKLTINISLKGVYTDAAEEYAVRFLVDQNKEKPGVYTLILVGKIAVNRGLANFHMVYDCDNINDSGYTIEDVSGVGLTSSNPKYSNLFTMWDDAEIKPQLSVIAEEGYKKISKENITETVEEINEATEVEATEVQQPDGEEENDDFIQQEEEIEELPDISENIEAETALDLSSVETKTIEFQINKLYENCEYIDAFADDYLYHCIEVTPDQLKTLPVKDDTIINNSFILHGFYNFRHILFGKVSPNSNNTSYFIGVPGMYCNRERFMASMFGFNNFKKSHRSDITNPYFGYWYQEF